MTGQLRASTVSAALRRAGLNPTGSGSINREGIKVSGKDPVSVRCDLDMPNARARAAANVTEALEDAGYAVVPNPYDPAILQVSYKRADS